jgi:putative ABC transport system permease protein
MRLAAQITNFFRNLLRRDRVESVLDEELNGYIEEMTARKVRTGMAPAEARRQALLEAGGVAQVKEDVREAWLGNTVDTAIRDVRYACRMLRRAPGFTAVVVFTLAIGIGATVTMFSVMHAVLWRPLPYPSADRIVYLQVDARGVANAGAAPGEVLDLEARSTTLEHLSIVAGVDANLEYNGEIDHLGAASVTDDLLPLLGAVPALGRPLHAKTDVPGMVRNILISDELWRRRFGADPAVVGREVKVNNLPMQVAGVLQPGFQPYLPASAQAHQQTDIWFPTGIENSRDYRGFCVLARVKPTATVRQANAELSALAGDFVREYQSRYPGGKLRFSVTPLQQELTHEARPALSLLAGAVGFVLLIACVNVANLMLARGTARQRELAIRKALGAGSIRLVRQMLTENLMVALGAGAIGLAIASICLEAIGKLGGTHLPMQARIAMNGPVLLFAAVLTVGVTLLFGVLPAVRLSSGRVSDPLRAGRSETAAPGARWLQRGLVIAEVALSIVPLVCCGLMLRSFVNLVGAPLGFNPAGVLTARLPLNMMQYSTEEQRWAVHRDVLERLRSTPGVEAVSAANPLPFSPWQWIRRVGRAEQPEIPGILATQQAVLHGYLPLVGTQLLQGRDFTLDDIKEKRPIAIVDDRLARRLWPEGALGRHLAIQNGKSRLELEVVGVTAPVRMTRVRDDDTPHFFVPYHVYPAEMSLVIKTRQSAVAMGTAIQRAASEAKTGRAAFDIRPMSDYVADSIGDTRFLLLVLSAFAASSVLLTAVGLYGTLAYLISQRTREFGIRMALGSGISAIVGMVVREGAMLTASGAAVGLVGAVVVARAIRQLLYNVAPFDRMTLVGVVGLLALVALAAAAAPAWRAARIDPNVSLRGD